MLTNANLEEFMKTILCVMLLLGANAFAGPERPVACNVQTLSDAEACMAKVAEAYTEYEEPNDGFATERIDLLVEALTALQLSRRMIASAEGAKFAGMLFEHGDEHHIYYFAIPVGENVSPYEIYDLNVVDLGYLNNPSAKALNPDTYLLGIEPAKTSDVYEDLKGQLQSHGN